MDAGQMYVGFASIAPLRHTHFRAPCSLYNKLRRTISSRISCCMYAPLLGTPFGLTHLKRGASKISISFEIKFIKLSYLNAQLLFLSLAP